MTCMLVLSVRVELMVMHGGVKNNYEHNVVVMTLPLHPQTADDINVEISYDMYACLECKSGAYGNAWWS